MERHTKQAFDWIISILRKINSKFQITGGFAARIYGSKRELADIDIDIEQKNIPEIQKETKNYITYGPKRYKDNEWNLVLMSLKYKGQEIDLCGSDSCKIFDKNAKKWVNEKVDFSQSVRKKVFGKIVPIISLKNLLSYKKKILRKVDLIDIKQLETKNK